jgi:transcription elongation factor GreA
MPRFDVRLSPEGKRELEDELQRLEGNRPGIAARLAQARDQANDPTENLDLRDAMDHLTQTERRISELRTTLAVAQPIEIAAKGSGAHLGATVTVRLSTGVRENYMLVSPAEAAPRRGRISVQSPIGQTLIGAKPGDERVAETPDGPERLTVLRVSYEG